MIRRFGESPQPGQRYRRRPSVYAVLPGDDGRLLLTFQGDPHFELQLPGGGIDPGESPIHALHREVMEETGWAIGPVRKLGTFRRYAYMPEYDMWAEKIGHIYMARPARRIGPPTETDHTPVWCSPQEAIAQLCNDCDAHFVKRCMGWV